MVIDEYWWAGIWNVNKKQEIKQAYEKRRMAFERWVFCARDSQDIAHAGY